MSYIMMALGWVLRLCSVLTGNYGVAIIIFTILIKAVLLPLTVKQQRSMLKTQKLQPLLMELQQKYANDKEKLNQETMKLYQKYQVNPMSGCLPLLIQLPILMMLYWVVKKPVVYIMGFGENDVWRIVSAVIEWSEGGADRMSSFLSTLGIDSIDKLTENGYKMFGMYEIQIARFLHANPDVMANHWITEAGKNFVVINFNFIGLDLSQTPNLGAFFGLFTGRINGLTRDVVLLWIIPLVQQVVLNKIINPGISEEQIEGEIVNAKKNRKKRKK